ncbi:MAG: DEAD/DEAH box helicase [Planctomycetes bacterium]|nr:DEAD/DEAH box helicase [Planctomycetota bacterium]MCB9910787.1 DEAD/DEAH box helicase [Planctomycetota bacterium]MCB9912814.1 DEAD/DEAH box helicase [Planctomycetota bacterium]
MFRPFPNRPRLWRPGRTTGILWDPPPFPVSDSSLSYGSESSRCGALLREIPPRSVITNQTAESPSETGFHSFHLRSSLQKGIDAAGFTELRPIQRDAIPAALKGRDVLGLAQTGTGKTCAFAVPIIERILDVDPPGPSALIVAPTRELVLQIQAEIQLLAKFADIRTVTIFGGTGAPAQIRGLRAKPDILIACPGRLLDLYKQGVVNLKNIETLVLDEADHMFDQGFLPDIKRIIAVLPKKRQNLLFSATMPREIRGLADAILQDPKVVELASAAPAETIDHALYPCQEGRKLEMLDHLLREEGFKSAIVFLRTKRRVKLIAEKLARSGHRAVGLQGNMSQVQRVKAMEGFRKGSFDILVATDIAARGIDVANVSQVINFDIPNTPDTYTHRIGRTGRAEATGRACTLVADDDYAMVKAIENKLGAQIPRARVQGFGKGEGRPSSETMTRGEAWDARPPRSGSGRSGGGGGRGRSGSGQSPKAGAAKSFGSSPARSGGSGGSRRRGAGRRRRTY